MADNVEFGMNMNFGDSFKNLSELKKKIAEVEDALRKTNDPKIMEGLSNSLTKLTGELNKFKNEMISVVTIMKNADKQIFSNIGKGLSSGFNLAIQSVNAMANSTQNLVNLLQKAQGIAASTQMNTAMGSGGSTRPSRPGSTQAVNTPDESSVLYANATAYQKLQNEFKLYHDAILNARTELELLKIKTVDFTNATDNEKLKMQELNAVIDQNQVKMNKVNEPLRNVEKQMGGSNVSKYKNELFSLQQVFREMPAFAYGASTGLMALSNNLPILADDFMKVANATKTAEGGTANYGSALKTFLGGLFSWQTAMVAGVTILTMYGEEIWNSITGTEKLTDAQKKQKKEMDGLIEGYHKQISEVEYYNNLLQDSNLTAEEQLDLLVQIEELTGVDLTVSYNSMTDAISAADMATKYYMDTIREEIALQVNKDKIMKALVEQEKATSKMIGIDARKKIDTDLKDFDTVKIRAELAGKSAKELKKILEDQAGFLGSGTFDIANVLTKVAGQKLTNVDQVRAMRDLVQATYDYKKAQDIIDGATQRSIVINKAHKGSLEGKEKSISETAKKIQQNAYFELQQYGELRNSAKELGIQMTGDLTEENRKRIDIAVNQYQIKRNYELLEGENTRRERLKSKAEELKLEKKSVEDIKKVKHDFTIDELKTLKEMNVITQSSYDALTISFDKSKTAANNAKSAFASLREELKGIAGSIQEAFSGNKIMDNVKGSGKKTTTTPLFMKPGAKSQLEQENIRLSVEIKKLNDQLNKTILKGDDNTNKVRINKRKLYNDETLSLEKMLIQDLDSLEELRVKLLNSSFEKEILLVEEKYDTLIRKANERYDSEMDILRKIFDAKQDNIDQEEQWQTLLDSSKTQKAYDANFVKYQEFRKQQDTKFEAFTVTDSQGVRALDLLTKQITNLNKNMQKELTAASKKATLDRYNFEKDFNKKLFLETLVEDNAISLDLRRQQEINFTKDLQEINKQREFQYRESSKEYIGLSGTAYNIKDLEKYKKTLESLISSDPASSMVGELGLAIKALEGTLTDFKGVWDEGQQSFDKFWKEYSEKTTKNNEVLNAIKERDKKLAQINKERNALLDKNGSMSLSGVKLNKEREDAINALDLIDVSIENTNKQIKVSKDDAKNAQKAIDDNNEKIIKLKKSGSAFGSLFGTDNQEKIDNKVISLREEIKGLYKVIQDADKNKIKDAETLKSLDKERLAAALRLNAATEAISVDAGKQQKDLDDREKKIKADYNKVISEQKNINKDFDEKTKGLNKNFLRFREILEGIEKETPTVDPTIKAEQFKEAFTKLIKELNDSSPKVEVAVVPQVQKTGSTTKPGVTTNIVTPNSAFQKEDIKQLTPAEKEALRLKAEERIKQYLLEEERQYQKLLGQGFGEVLTGKNASNLENNMDDSFASNIDKLEEFKKELSKATDPEEVKRLTENIKLLNKEIEKLDKKGPSSVTSDVTISKDDKGGLVYGQKLKPKKGTEEYKADKQKTKQLNKEWQDQDKFNREIERQTFEHEKRVYLLKKESNMVTEQDTIDMHFKEIEMLKKKREWYDADFKKYADASIKMVESVYSIYEAYTNGAMQIANDRMALQDQLTQNILANYDREIAKINDMMATQKMSDSERINSEQKVMDITNERALVEKNQKVASLEMQKRQIEINKKMALAQAAIAGGIAIANVVQMATKSGAVAAAGGPFVFAATLAAGLTSVAGAMMSANTAIKSAEYQTQTVDAEIAGIESAYLEGINKGKSATSQQQNGPAAPLTTFNADLVNQGQSNANYGINDTLGGYKIYVTQADIQNANNQTSKIKKKVTFG
jgi:hypothetical protein